MPEEAFELRILDDNGKPYDTDAVAIALGRIVRAVELRGGEITAPSVYIEADFPQYPDAPKPRQSD